MYRATPTGSRYFCSCTIMSSQKNKCAIPGIEHGICQLRVGYFVYLNYLACFLSLTLFVHFTFSPPTLLPYCRIGASRLIYYDFPVSSECSYRWATMTVKPPKRIELSTFHETGGDHSDFTSCLFTKYGVWLLFDFIAAISAISICPKIAYVPFHTHGFQIRPLVYDNI